MLFLFCIWSVVDLSLGILLVEYLRYHGFHVLANLHEVLIEDALTLITALEGVELGQWHILAFFFFNVCHVEVGLAIELTGLELVALLYVHTAIHACLGCHKVSCGLSADPSCRHIRDFTGWHKTVHVLIQVDARFVSIDGHTFLQLHHFSEDVGGQPFERFLASCRTAHHIAYGGDNLLHTNLAIVGFQLRQLLKAQGYAHLVASGCAYQSVYFVEVEGRQLVHDDAHGDVLALSCVHSCYQAIENKGVQCSNDALHFWVIGYQQIARILRVTDLQVEVIAVLVEYPIAFLGGKT